MQTFLPYPGFAESAAVLDDRRLGKQRVETFQTLRAVVWPAYGWKNHPAVAMWRGFVPALVSYGVAVCDEWTARGRADATRPQLLAFTEGREATWADLVDAGGLPPWIGRDDVHRSHQSSLLRKDPEHYRTAFPDVADDLPYVWPGSVFPRWPVRRTDPGGVDVDAAARLCGLDCATDEQRAAVEALRGAGECVVRVPREPAGTTTALVAALSLPGLTAWIVPGDRPNPGPPPPVERTATEPGGRTSASIARAPGPDDVAAMSAEAAATHELRFLRAARLPATPPGGTGLVVLDGAETPPVGWESQPTLVLDPRPA